MSNTVDCALIERRDFDGIQMTPAFEETRKAIEEFDVRNDDVWITSYSKCGTTWCQELVWLVANNLDYEGAKQHLEIRFPFIEYAAIAHGVAGFIKEHNIDTGFSDDSTFPDPIELLKQDKNKRFVKSHLPFHFLPKQLTGGSKTPKVIHVMRDPKQVVPSYYYHSIHAFPMFKGTLDQFVDAYITGKVLYGDYFTTVLSYWNQRHLPNLLILTYEEMYSDLPDVIRKVAKFLGKSYCEEEIKKLAHHLNFDQMKDNRAVNKADFIKNEETKFMRKGKADSYKTELTPEMIEKLDKWIEERTRGTELPYRNI